MTTREKYEAVAAAMRAHPLAARGEVKEQDFAMTGGENRAYRRVELRVRVTSPSAAAEVMAALGCLAVETGADGCFLYSLDVGEADIHVAVSRPLDTGELERMRGTDDARAWRTEATEMRATDVTR